jgi:hypothetical protein
LGYFVETGQVDLGVVIQGEAGKLFHGLDEFPPTSLTGQSIQLGSVEALRREGRSRLDNLLMVGRVNLVSAEAGHGDVGVPGD